MQKQNFMLLWCSFKEGIRTNHHKCNEENKKEEPTAILIALLLSNTKYINNSAVHQIEDEKFD